MFSTDPVQAPSLNSIFIKRFGLEVLVQSLPIFRAENLTVLPDFHPCCETKKQVFFFVYRNHFCSSSFDFLTYIKTVILK